jgi:O-antigen ligase/Tfp pilus assembly protein PilF
LKNVVFDTLGERMNLDKKLLQDYLKISITVAVLSFFIFFSGTKFNLIELSSLTKTAIVLFVLWTVFLVIGKTRQMPADLPIAISIGILLFTSFAGDMPRQAFVEVGYLLIAILVFYFVVGTMHRGWDPKIISKSILIIGGVFMILSWMEFLAWYLRWLHINPGNFMPEFPYRLPAPNFICVILNVWVLFALGHWFYVKEKFPRVLLSLYILSGLGIIYLTSSRGGWIGLFAGICVFTAVYLFTKQKERLLSILKIVRKPKFLIPIILVIAIVLAGIVMVMLQTESHPTHGPILQSRDLLWKPAFAAIKDSPIIGHGPYAYVFYYLKGQNLPQHDLYDYAHSIYFDALVSSGIIGLLGLLWLIFAAGKILLKTLKDMDQYLFYLGMGVIGGFSAFVVHGLFDSVHHTVPVSLWNMCILLAIPAGYLSRENQKRNVVSIIAGALLFPALTWYLIAGQTYEKGINQAIDGQLQESISVLEKAKTQDPFMPFISQQEGIVYAQLAAETEDPDDLLAAANEFEDTIKQDMYWAPTYLDLGMIYAQLGDMDLAGENLNKAVELMPKGLLFNWNLATYYEGIEMYDLAQDYYEPCITLDNRIIFSEKWNESTFRQEIANQWKLQNPDLAEAYNAAMNTTTGVSLAVQLPTIANNEANTLHYLVKASEAIQSGDYENATYYLDISQLAYANRPESNIYTIWLYAELDAINGDYESAISFGERAVKAVLQPGLYGPGTYSQQVYGAVIYRRHELPDYFVPQVNPVPITYEWQQRMEKLADWYGEVGDAEKQAYWLDVADHIQEY